MAPSANFVDLCRICATETQSIVRHFIFEGEGKLRDLSKKIAACLPVKVKEDDRLPKVLCGECVYKLDLLHEFREKSQKTEAYLFTLIDGPASDHHVRKQSSSQLRGAEEEDDDDSHGGGDNDGGHDIDDDDDELEPVTPAPVRRNAQGQICEPEVVIKVEEDNSKGDAAAASATSATPSAAAGAEDGGSPSKRPRRAAANKRPIREDSPSLEAPSSPPPPKRRGRKPKGVTPTSSAAAATSTATPGTSTSGNKSTEEGANPPKALTNTPTTAEAKKPSEENVQQQISTLKLMLNAHFGNANSNSEVTYRCAGCPKVFKGFANFKMHFDATHANIKNVCKTCYVVFTNENTMKEHVSELELLVNAKRKEVTKIQTPPQKPIQQQKQQQPSPQQSKTVNLLSIKKQQLSHFDDSLNVAHEVEIVNEPTVQRDEEPFDVNLLTKRNKNSPSTSKQEESTPKVIILHNVESNLQPVKLKLPRKKSKNPMKGSADRRIVSIKIHKTRSHDLKPVKVTPKSLKLSQQKNSINFVSSEHKPLAKKFPLGITIEGKSQVSPQIKKIMDDISEKEALIVSQTAKQLIKKLPTKKKSRASMIREAREAGEYLCVECDLTFVSERGLKCHQAYHPDYEGKKKWLRCDMCPKTFFREEILLCHKRTHSGLKPYQCSLCEQAFTSNGGRKKHELRHGEHYKCAKCGKPYATEAERDLHLASSHTNVKEKANKTHLCILCNKTFPSSSRVHSHVKRVHFDTRPFPCSICTKRFKTKGEMKNHQKTHDKNRPFTHKCSVCDKGFYKAQNLSVHVLRWHTENSARCGICYRVFPTTEERDAHFELHAKEFDTREEFLECVETIGNIKKICRSCKIGFKDEEEFKAHYNEKHEPLKCHICDRKTPTERAMIRHKWILHGVGEAPFTCGDCQQGFQRKYDLLSHIKSTHIPPDVSSIKVKSKVPSRLVDTGPKNLLATIKSFGCKICEEEFQTLQLFQEHEKKHTKSNIKTSKTVKSKK